MRASAISQMVLCVAAVLLIPQALECCHGQAQTVLESLAEQRGEAEMSGMSMEHHHAMQAGHAAASPDFHGILWGDSRAGRTGIDGAERVSLPMGEAAGQSPAVTAVLPSVQSPIGMIGPASRPSDASGTMGRVVRPPIPPPRASA